MVREETMDPYPPEVRKHMKAFYDSLSEKDRRRYAAVEAEKANRSISVMMAYFFI